MSEVIAIKTLNGHPLVDTEARARIEALEAKDAPVVILPETELTYNEDTGFLLTSPPSATPTEGATAVITYNGVEYTSPVLRVEDEGMAFYMMGNVSLIGMTDGNPDAPFCVALMPDGIGDMYAQVTTTDGATSVTLSIVQTGGASADSGNGTSDFIVTGMLNTTTFSVSNVSKTYDEVHAAAEERKNIKLYLDVQDQGSYVVMPLTQMTPTVLAFGSIISEGARWRAQYTADGMTVKVG